MPKIVKSKTQLPARLLNFAAIPSSPPQLCYSDIQPESIGTLRMNFEPFMNAAMWVSQLASHRVPTRLINSLQ